MAEAASASSATAPPRRRPPQARHASLPPLIRRRSTQERIDAILDTARERAESPSTTQSLRAGASPRMAPPLGSPILERDGAPDETTGIISKQPDRGPRLNYQSMTQSRGQSSGSQPSQQRSALHRKGSALDGQPPPPGARDQAEADAGEPSQTARAGQSWSSRVGVLLMDFQSVELENKGSVARDHLALERTFLAWLRTSLAFASIGIAITQLFRLNTAVSTDAGPGKENPHIIKLHQVGKPLGATFLAISIMMLFLGYNRYVTSQQWIMKGKFPASRGTIMLVSLAAFTLMVASLVVVIVVQPAAADG